MDVEARKKKIWALGIVGFFALVSVLTYAYNEYYVYLSAYLWFGCSTAGSVFLRRSGTCLPWACLGWWSAS